MPQAPDDLKSFSSFVQVVAHLRGPEGCPWDKEQTHQTLARFTLEEAAELAAALDSGEAQHICEELGDVLLQVVLNAEVARQAGQFDISDVIEGINQKMIRRHPHVFAGTKVKSSSEVITNWQKLKDQENGAETKERRFQFSPALSALLVSHKIGEKTSQLNFDWPDEKGVFEKVKEEFHELEEALQSQPSKERQTRALEEAGDLLFSVAQLVRHLGGDAEQTLRATNQRFESRFFTMLEQIKAADQNLSELSPDEMEKAWQKAKRAQKKGAPL